MATSSSRVPENVFGKYYVDDTCIYCELCVETAPEIFRECNEMGWAYVYHQPDTIEQIQMATEALEGCPTYSIGCDG